MSSFGYGSSNDECCTNFDYQLDLKSSQLISFVNVFWKNTSFIVILVALPVG